MNERPNRSITVMELVMKPIVVFLLGISLNFVLGEVEASDSIRNSEKEESETRRVVRKEVSEVRLKRLTQELTIHLQEVINARKGEGRLDELASFSWTRVCPVTAYGVWVEKNMYGKKYMGTARTTFVINEVGVIEHIIKKVDNKNASQQILDLYEAK